MNGETHEGAAHPRGPVAREHIAAHGLAPEDVRIIPGAAGGPKGLILGPIDRFLFGDWLPRSNQPVDLVGASIGAWRLANACLRDPVRPSSSSSTATSTSTSRCRRARSG